MKLFDNLLAVIAPQDCVGCSTEGALLCGDCRRDLAPAILCCYRCHLVGDTFATCTLCRSVSPLGSVLVATRYEAAAKDVIWKLKFGRARGAGTEIAQVVEDRLRLGRLLAGRRNIIITHAPTATRRVRQRGYDQAALIAQSLARGNGVPYCRLLARRGHLKQIGATKAMRTSQLNGAFYAVHRRRIRGAHVILVDDVITTGATLEAAARVLLDAGARRVDAVVFAQA